MERLDLAGTWMLKEIGRDELIEGTLPGCNYLDLMKNEKIPDPFWGMNEEKAKEIAEDGRVRLSVERTANGQLALDETRGTLCCGISRA